MRSPPRLLGTHKVLSKPRGPLLCILSSPVGVTSHLLFASHSDNCQPDGCLTREPAQQSGLGPSWDWTVCQMQKQLLHPHPKHLFQHPLLIGVSPRPRGLSWQRLPKRQGHAFHKYLLSTYNAPGFGEMAVNKTNEDHTPMEFTLWSWMGVVGGTECNSSHLKSKLSLPHYPHHSWLVNIEYFHAELLRSWLKGEGFKFSVLKPTVL